MKRTLALLALVCMLIPAPMLAADAKATPVPPKHTTIKAISEDSITTDTGAISKDYKINERTIILFRGEKVKTDKLAPGMRVTVTPTFDGESASMISASVAPKVATTGSGAATTAAK
jgi:hypothetical protein